MDYESKDIEYQKQRLRQKIDKLETEYIDLHTYQSVTSEVDSMDYGPRYYERSNDLNQNLSDRISNLNSEIDSCKSDLNKLEEEDK